MATMKDVAALAGVSIATVSATLSGTAFVSPELKARVLAAVDRLGYTPNTVARGLKRGRTTLIGLVVPDITNPFFTELVDVVQRGARAAGYSVLLGVSDQDPSVEAELVRFMRSHQAAGTILCPTGTEAGTAALAALAGPMRLVAADNAPMAAGMDTVLLDNRRAAALAAGHLIALGHRRIGTVAGPQHQVPGRERLDGFRAAMADAGLPVPDDLVRLGAFRVDAALAAGRALFAGPNRPTAVFVANNHMLIGVMQALAETGLSVPGDVSVAAIDDFPWAAAFRPALTTVRQPIAAMATAALERLLARIDGDDGEPLRLTLAPELAVRDSCAPPPG